MAIWEKFCKSDPEICADVTVHSFSQDEAQNNTSPTANAYGRIPSYLMLWLLGYVTEELSYGFISYT